MGRSRYKFFEEYYPYFITSSIVKGVPLFSDPNIAHLILDAIAFLQQQRGVNLYAYVVMENHIHLIAKSNDLPEHLRNFKSFTAHQIINYLKRTNKNYVLNQLKRAKKAHKSDSKFQVWQEGSNPKQIFDFKVINQKINYLHFNPVNRGYVDCPEHWRYSSARDYLGKQGLIPVTIFRG